MTRADGSAADRERGSVWARGGSLQVRVFAGVDPVSGRDRYLSESVKGTDRAARRRADKVMARLQTEVDGQRSAQSSVSLGYTLDEWLGTVELEDSTRDTYVGYIERSIRPTLGGIAVSKLSTRTLESFYAELRRCRTRCNGRPFPSTEPTAHMTVPRLDAHRMSAARWRPRPFGRSTPSSAVR
jgi:integrase